MEDILTDKSEWVDFIPTKFTIANHTFKVNQYDKLYSDNNEIEGCFCYEELEICIKIKDFKGNLLPEEIIRNSFWHETMHVFNYLWNTETNESLAQTFANFMREFETSVKYAT